jgi:hypothetical protein
MRSSGDEGLVSIAECDNGVVDDGLTGTEATRWIVNHAFEQLGMHRVSLIVLEDNVRAIRLYEKM